MKSISKAIFTGFLIAAVFTGSSVFAAKDLTPKKILVHKTSLTQLGIPIPQGKGNAADLWMQLQGTQKKPGPWEIKYGNSKKEEETSLDSEDVKILLRLAWYSQFSFYPKPYSLPESILDLSTIEVPTVGLLRSIMRRAVAQASTLAEQGKKAEAKKILQSIIIIGRQLQEGQPYTPFVLFLIGLSIEKIGADALSDFYKQNNDITRSTLFALYSQEIDSLKGGSRVLDIGYVYLYSLALTSKTPQLVTRELIRTAYDAAHLTEQEVWNQLESFMILDDPTLQMEVFSSLIYMRNTLRSKAFAPESILATKALLRYAKSKNPLIAKYARQALKLTPDQVLKWMQVQRESGY